MTAREVTGVIAPRDGGSVVGPLHISRELLAGAYRNDAVLEYYELQLLYNGAANVRTWDVYDEDDRYIETINLDAVRTASGLLELLSEIRADGTDSRDNRVTMSESDEVRLGDLAGDGLRQARDDLDVAIEDIESAVRAGRPPTEAGLERLRAELYQLNELVEGDLAEVTLGVQPFAAPTSLEPSRPGSECGGEPDR